MDEIPNIQGFQWDEGNAEKNLVSHQVTRSEIELVFFSVPVVIDESFPQQDRESRYYALGQTDAGRMLFVVFTIRDQLIRVISARDVSRRERGAYLNDDEKTDTEI